MKKIWLLAAAGLLTVAFTVSDGFSLSFWGGDKKTLTPQQGQIAIPLADIDDGKAHFFQVKAADGVPVTFFTLKSKDGSIRAAVDACDVCYRAGKGYEQDGDFMICQNCGQRFASHLINVIKGGCNPAPLNRTVVGEKLVIAMDEINRSSWYCQFKQ